MATQGAGFQNVSKEKVLHGTNLNQPSLEIFGNRPDLRPRHNASFTSSRHPGMNNSIGSYTGSNRMNNSMQTQRTKDRSEIRRDLRRRHTSGVPGHVKWTKFMHSKTKNHIVAMIGEFIGTTMFLFFAFAGTQVANIGSGTNTDNSTTGGATGFNIATLLYISLSFGFSLMVNAWIFFRISGGLFNPAVTLALALLGAFDTVRALLLAFGQFSGACFAAYLVSVMFPVPFNVQTTLAGGTSVTQGLFIEALCTAELIFTIIMLAAEKHRSTFIAPVGIGLALFIGELVAVYYTGGSLNPARSFGPAAVDHSFQENHWIYWIGPLIGTLLAVGFYKFFKLLEYELVNPGQDGDIENDPTQNPNHDLAQVVDQRQAEVDEIDVIEREGGFDVLSNGTSTAASVTAGEGAVDSTGGREAVVGDQEHPQREGNHGESAADLEANWAGSSSTGEAGSDETAVNKTDLRQRR